MTGDSALRTSLAKDTNWDSYVAQRATLHPCGFVVPVPLSREYSEGAEGGPKRQIHAWFTRGVHGKLQQRASRHNGRRRGHGEYGRQDRQPSPRAIIVCGRRSLCEILHGVLPGSPFRPASHAYGSIWRVLRFHYFSLSHQFLSFFHVLGLSVISLHTRTTSLRRLANLFRH